MAMCAQGKYFKCSNVTYWINAWNRSKPSSSTAKAAIHKRHFSALHMANKWHKIHTAGCKYFQAIKLSLFPYSLKIVYFQFYYNTNLYFNTLVTIIVSKNRYNIENAERQLNIKHFFSDSRTNYKTGEIIDNQVLHTSIQCVLHL